MPPARAALAPLTLGALCILLAACPGRPANSGVPASAARPVASGPHASKSGVGFRLSNADGDDVARPAATQGKVLSDADAAKVLARLPPMKEDARPADFALRGKSLPPPRAGKTVATPFPPPPSTAAPSPVGAGPLRVLRRTPEGHVALAPYVAVTFSHPMVPVTSIDELARIPVPVEIKPRPAGEWRWVGTQTAQFQPQARFPMATDYEVAVTAGAKASTGQALVQAERWTFSTPAPTLARSSPGEDTPTRLDALAFAEFDQEIDPAAVLAATRATANGAAVALRLATPAEIEDDADVRRLVAKAEPRRSLALAPVRPLPAGAAVVVTFPAGTPSREGPKRTTKDQSFGFHTHGAMKLLEHACGGGAECPPLTPFRLRFSNPIDGKTFDAKLVVIDPPVPGLKVTAMGQMIVAQGRTKGKTTYKIMVAKALRDTFGQTLDADATVTIKTGPARPVLFGEEGEMSVVEPGSRAYPVFSVNQPTLRVTVLAVGPEHWSAYRAWRAEWDRARWGERALGPLPAPPGRVVRSEVLQTRIAADEIVETPIDLGGALKSGLGQAIVLVEPTTPAPRGQHRESVRAWVQATNVGLDAVVDHERATVWATDLATGAPLEGVDVTLAGASSKTGADGLATLASSDADIVVARGGGDLALLPAPAWSQLRGAQPRDALRWLVFDDRRMYKPKEEVHAKGWLRAIEGRKGGDVVRARFASRASVRWTAKDARGSGFAKGTADLDETGGFDLAFTIPDRANLGHATVELQAEGTDLEGARGAHGFQIQEFRRPEFEVSASAGPGPHLVGGHAIATVAAKYYAGGGLPAAPTAWRVTRGIGHFTPPGRSEWHFGEATPFWPWFRHDAGRGGRIKNRTGTETWSGTTNPAGEHRLRIDFDASTPPFAMSLGVEATVTDVNRQAWSAHADLVVHPADIYVGLREERRFVRAGEPLVVRAIATDLDGKVAPGRKVSLRSSRIDTTWEHDEAVERELDVVTCDVTSAAEPSRCTFATKQGGTHRVTAVVTDTLGRASQSELELWVAGGEVPRDASLPPGQAQLTASKTAYQPGETAEIMVVAPFAPAEGMLVVMRSGVVKVERFTARETTTVVRVPLDDTMVPNVSVGIRLVGSAPKEDAAGKPTSARRPAFATAQTTLVVKPTSRTLAVAVMPREREIEPGGKTSVDVVVKDAKGALVPGATVALAAVDEAVLALSGAKTPDPIAVFYTPRPDGTFDLGLRPSVVLGRPPGAGLGGFGGGAKDGHVMAEMVMMAPAPMAVPRAGLRETASANADVGQAVMQVRTDFAALAVWAPRLVTDARGHAEIALKLPDSLTRYRVYAVVVAREHEFGSGEESVTARLPLMARPSPPRFLNFGDQFELPIVVQNQTRAPMTVDVVARAANAKLTAGAGRRVEVPANDRVEIRLPATAAMAGTARFQVGVASGRWSDAAEVSLPVWTPATTEAFATYGEIDQGAITQPVKMPAGVVPGFGGLEITTSSTAMQALTDAVLYLVRYPYECSEQIASRVLAVAALKDVLAAFEAEGLPPPAELVASVASDLKRLELKQTPSGGWAFWRADQTPVPFVSVHVAHALARAKAKGFAVPDGMTKRATAFLRDIERHYDGYYSPDTRRAISAYALYVRKLLGDADAPKARRLIAEAGSAEKLPIEALGWLLPVLSRDAASASEVAAIRRHLGNRVTEAAGTAHFVTSYGDQGAEVLLHSDRRADGVLLEAIIDDQPKSTVIPKLVAGLLGHRKAGRWTSTQENAFVLLALDRYFQTYEKETPNFVARAWLGDRFAGEQAFKGRTTDRKRIDVPMQLLAQMPTDQSLVLAKEGAGRLYYRIGMQYAPADLTPPPIDRGFTVERTYEAVGETGDVRRDPTGTWHVKAGASVRVRLHLVTVARRYHVALVDPLPAGLEPVNAALAVTGEIPRDPKEASRAGPWWWRMTWYEHQNMRDERVEAFASLLYDGVYDYSYIARATTPGTFIVPPPRAEEMYAPETFGRGAGTRLVVE